MNSIAGWKWGGLAVGLLACIALTFATLAVASQSTGLAVVVALAPAILLAALAYIPLIRTHLFSSWSSDVTRKAVQGFSLLLVSAVVVETLIGAGTTQGFAAVGVVKSVLLPLAYAVCVWALVGVRESTAVRIRIPGAVVALISVTVAATVVPILSSNASSFRWIAMAQGVLLVGGLVVFIVAGMRIGDSGEPEVLRFLGLLFIWSIFSSAFGGNLRPFPALVIPAFFACLILVVSGRTRDRWTWATFALISAAFIYTQFLQGRSLELSAGRSAQIAVACAIILMVLIPPLFRKIALGLAGIAVVAFAATTPFIGIFFGEYAQLEDVTIAQRGFESAVAIRSITDSTLTLLLGNGPGATVNLVNSPDALTLLSSGRDLLAVDDVHLITSWFLIKFGLAGLAVLLVVLFQMLLVIGRAVWAKELVPVEVALAVLLGSAVVYALPAATNLFSNPLVGLSFGMLLARVSARYRVAKAGGLDGVGLLPLLEPEPTRRSGIAARARP